MEDGIQSPAHVKQFCVFYPCFEPQQQVSRAPLDEMTGRTTEHIVAHAAGFGAGLTHRNSAVAALLGRRSCARNARFIGQIANAKQFRSGS